jgi:hypothetical protein
VAIEIDGPAGSDRRLLAIGAAMEAALLPMPAPALAFQAVDSSRRTFR